MRFWFLVFQMNPTMYGFKSYSHGMLCRMPSSKTEFSVFQWFSLKFLKNMIACNSFVALPYLSDLNIVEACANFIFSGIITNLLELLKWCNKGVFVWSYDDLITFTYSSSNLGVYYSSKNLVGFFKLIFTKILYWSVIIFDFFMSGSDASQLQIRWTLRVFQTSIYNMVQKNCSVVRIFLYYYCGYIVLQWHFSVIPVFDFFYYFFVRAEAVAQTCSVKKVFLEILQNSKENTSVRVSFFNKVPGLRPMKNSQENTCIKVSFLIKLQTWGLRPATLLKKRL